MKKFIFLLPIFILCLTGCGNEKTGSIVCTLSSKDAVNGYQLNSTYKINYKGEIVESVETEEVVTSDKEEILSTFETSLNNTYKKTNDTYGGYTYKVTKEDGKVTSKVTIDYSKMDIEQFVTDQPALKSYVKDNKLLTDGLKSMYETLGATCK